MQKPDKKITAVGVGGAFSLILVWALSLAGVETPNPVAQGFTLLATFAAGYLIPNTPNGPKPVQ